MFRVILVFAAAACVLAVPSPAPAGCPAGSVGIGESQLCPDTGSCAGYGLTATVYAAGSCQPLGTSTTISSAGFCDNTFTNGVDIACDEQPHYVGVKSITIPNLGSFTNCTPLDESIACDDSRWGWSEIAVCCN